MFGQNAIHGRKTFAGRDDLLVTSIFYTLQGEGPFAGQPAVFVRLTHCNLQCGFCDTNFSTGEWMRREEVIEKLQTVVPTGVRPRVLVVTGGEPLLQQEALNPLLTIAALNFHVVQVESNGRVPMVNKLPGSTYLVVSPKCNDLANGVRLKKHHYLKPPEHVLERANCLKFVLTADATSPYYTVPDWAFRWRDASGLPVYVSPMAEYKRRPDLSFLASGTLGERSEAERVSFWESDLLDMKRVRANHEYAAAYAMAHGVYMTMQMQLFGGLK